MKFKRQIKPYRAAAGGWGSLEATTRFVLDSKAALKNMRNLMRMNKARGFDCPGCAWGDDNKSTFSFCENGAKAVTWEATRRMVDTDFFAKHSVTTLYTQSDYFLEYQGRLTHPLRYNAETDHYEPISWDDAFALIAQHIKAMDHPDQMELYTSGRASNEASWLYQLFGRLMGTNNFPDCSNMCHEASGTGLKRSIGVGKGTIRLDDFDHADAIFVFGQNPGTNHPRMLHSLRHAADHGAKIVTFNTLRERGLERFADPQKPLEVVTSKAGNISSSYYQPNLGGDMAAVRGMVKSLLETHRARLAAGESGLFDQTFINAKTNGIEAYLDAVDNTSWMQIVAQSGLTQAQIREAAAIYQSADRVICTWAMGITQHKHSVDTVREITNLQLLFGQLGKKGAGLCPVRGHSNVQGNRTMGIDEKPAKAFLDALGNHFNFEPPRAAGHNTVEALNAMLRDEVKVLIALGGNLAAAAPDSPRTEEAMSRCGLTVHISTKLNRSHLVPGHDGLILPTLGRTERDLQATGNQFITVEDSFSMVHASEGIGIPLAETQRSETWIVAGIAEAVLGDEKVKWRELAGDYNLIREHIAATIPGFADFNAKCDIPGGFYLGNAAAELRFNTPSQKAEFNASALPTSLFPNLDQDVPFTLQTLRSHDQYNTTIYGLDDRYRGVFGQREVVFINPDDMADLGFTEGQNVDIETLWNDGITRRVSGFKLVPYNIPRGNLAAYYPETNPLVPLNSFGDDSGTPTSKSVPVKLELSGALADQRIA
ncbi:FdhF/YdeP family oxidoreductase [Pantoea agglomerans]|jgi:molybdopterin-dependent oxidoreductase alpha subunit|uniref:Molybdopterin-dependent oxidoreductase alpha subunit n=1 Tax=[Curtobacterium] plantarum TaxID=221276 RepID=A0ABT9T9J3_9GAMM|nr:MULTISPECIES: FdhF/YdeP family oxidoreductase [Pantoea]KEY43409.1 oxidoreductase, major subunit [Pantoea agglomerans]MBA8868150.1 molybdopterin-dependent oxidoreductase alpha subunit [Pantoea agglomerans]MBA8873151.1 molybdopterin-dependent oxidoreductase alpha subunit [Pantoea agglomerans]MDF2912984.1 CbbBc protein [Pantoea agglomerans]MDQ0019068.1 molybdopterin-dependent oxidoreductase alpha subunit [[Curtobacterium] plantarum]